MPSKTIVTGTINDAAGNPATSGTVLFTIDGGDSNFYYILNTMSLVPNSVLATINSSGQLKAENGTDPLEIWGNDTISPSNTWYNLRFAPNGFVTQATPYFVISGATYDLSSPTFYDPASFVPDQPPINYAQIAADLVPAVNGQYTVGTALKQYAAGYIQQIFADEVTLNSGNRISSGNVEIAQRPSPGPLWKRSDSTLTSIVVVSNIATVTTSLPQTAQQVVNVFGSTVQQGLNGVKVVTSTPTTTTFTFATSGVPDGTYSASTLVILDLTNGPLSGNLTNAVWEQFTIDPAVDRSNYYDLYFQYQLYPHVDLYHVYSGYSGMSALVGSSAAAGQKVILVNNTTAFSIGQVVIIVSQDGTLSEQCLIASISAGVSITITTNLAHTYPAGSQVGLGGRSMSVDYYVESVMESTAGGDMYAYFANVYNASPLKNGQTHAFFNASTGLIGGSVNASANATYIESCQVVLNDNGFDAFAIGDVRNFNRTNDTAAHFEQWIGHYINSEGTKKCNAGYVASGKWIAGLDLVRCTFDSDQRAIQLAADQRMYFNCQAIPGADPYLLWGNTVGDSWIYYNSGTSSMIHVVTLIPVFEYDASNFNVNVNLHTTGHYVEFTSQTAPSAPASGKVAVYCDTSGGKQRVMALFSSGAAQIMATQP